MTGVILSIQSLMVSIPPFIKVSGAVLPLASVLIPIAYRIILTQRSLRKFARKENDESLRGRLLAHPGIVSNLIRRKGMEIVRHFGLADALRRRMLRLNSIEDANRLLDWPGSQGIFWVFLASLKSSRIARSFNAWLVDHADPSSLRNMALASKGQDFDNGKARILLDEAIEIVRNLSGDMEWTVRYFALRVIIDDTDNRSIRIVKNSLNDSHPIIRRTAIRGAFLDREDCINQLMSIALNDPVSEVRLSARDRIESTSPHLWQIDHNNLTVTQSLHILEQMKTGSKVDENLAILALKKDSAELRLASARFLEKAGTLLRLFKEANLGDMEDWNRRFALLSSSVSVGITGFLSHLQSTQAIDTLLLGARLLQQGGTAELMIPLARKAFDLWSAMPPYGKMLYRDAMTLACTRGNEKTWLLVREELKKRRAHNELLSFILPRLPRDEAHVFRDVLLEFLVDPQFIADDAYLDIMAKLPYSMFINPVLDILEADRIQHHYLVRLRALRILGAWQLEQALQSMIENLTLLPPDLYDCFRDHFEKMNDKVLNDRALFILKSPDSGLRAALVSCLPAGSVEALSEEIREGLNDANHEVRFACISALSRTKTLLTADSILRFLHDPVEDVRRKTAGIAGKKSTKDVLKLLETILFDTNESQVVRVAVLEGLASSHLLASVDILVRFLSLGHDLRDELLRALACKNDVKMFRKMVEHFKNSDAVLKEKLAEVFVLMGEKLEKTFSEMLKGGGPSMRPFLVEILTRTGFVENLINRLGQRDVQSRREAAELLSIIATLPAYRGIVHAVRDPDTEVRILAVRALETLVNEDNETILESLLSDPDKKVCRYTRWAVERIKAKKMTW